jgi:coenzyme F420-reducing hydrogenase delta subunit
VKYVQDLLDQIGIGGQRIAMFHMSSAMGGAFAQAVTQMTEKIKELGPNPAKVNSRRHSAEESPSSPATGD